MVVGVAVVAVLVLALVAVVVLLVVVLTIVRFWSFFLRRSRYHNGSPHVDREGKRKLRLTSRAQLALRFAAAKRGHSVFGVVLDQLY